MTMCTVGDTDEHDADSDSMWFANGTMAVAGARRYVRDILTDWDVDPDTVEAAVLCTSELVTNVYLHTNSSAAGVRVSAMQRRIYVTVREPLPSPDTVAVAGPMGMPPHTARRGRGLAILDSITDEWGISRAKQSTSTWFSLTASAKLPLRAVAPDAAAQVEDLLSSLLSDRDSRGSGHGRVSATRRVAHSPRE